MMKTYSGKFMQLLIAIVLSLPAFAQPNTEVDLDKDKPKQYENRKLGSEKTGEKKFTFPKKVLQNGYTHYNYYFNANQKLNEVVERAKLSFKDNYTELLPFYNYTLDGTAMSKGDLDSVIYKCTAGILLHDLRNSWIDNLYMLMGRAYLYRKDFDSASGCFQYINYVYAPKDDGYDIPIGSSASNDKGVFSVATNEKANIFKKITARPPSRNESFIWQARLYLEQNETGEAAGLLQILRNDPVFPKRLKTDLEELTALWYYKQEMYDSAATHLTNALDNAADRFEKARWEYLIGQMYQIGGKDSAAIRYYEKSVAHTTDPLMEIYARLNIVGLASASKKDALQENLNELLKLARKDRYDTYRDIIYYAAALLELKRNGYDAAQKHLLSSVKYNVDNPQQKTQSFILLGDLNYSRNSFVAAHNFYDSIPANGTKNLRRSDSSRLALRKPALKTIAENILSISKEDSLQKVALMPEPERTAYIKKTVKRLRKEMGVKADEDEYSENPAAVKNNGKTDIFDDDKSGTWYFLNNSQKSKGFSEFKAQWGKRDNVDNWRRQSAIEKTAGSINKAPQPGLDVDDEIPTVKGGNAKDDKAKEEEVNDDISFEGLMSKLPLTKEKVEESNKTIAVALFSNGETFQNKLENYPPAIEAYNELLRRFPEDEKKEDALFNLIYCNTKEGNISKADSLRKALATAFPDGKLSKKMQAGNAKPETKNADAATKKYEEIYNLFLEGKFEEAKNEKAKADSLNGKNYWTPQLLFIEAVYYINKREDSLAINKLQSLVSMFAKSPLAPKATNIISVLKRRKEIETYLTDLKVERNEDDAERPIDLTTPTTTVTKVDSSKTNVTAKPVTPTMKVPEKTNVKDTSVVTKSAFTYNAADPQYVGVILDKIDAMFIREAKNSYTTFNKQKFYNRKIALSSISIDERYTLLLMGPFANAEDAINYVDKARPATADEILTWMTPDKYSYIIISSSNLTLLQENKDIKSYKQLLEKIAPGKF